MFKNITPKALKASIESCSEVLTKLFNNTILTSNFPDKLKVADVSPIFKKDDLQKSRNYRSVSVLSVVWMLKNICNHICVVIEKGLAPNKCFCLF